MNFPPDAPSRLRELYAAWADTNVNERAAFQTWMLRFCEALGVATPEPPTDAYRFELPVSVVDREGRESTNFIDCWKAGHFALEAKASGDGARNDALLRKAVGQVRNYVAHVSGDPPPYLMVLDVPRTLVARSEDSLWSDIDVALCVADSSLVDAQAEAMREATGVIDQTQYVNISVITLSVDDAKRLAAEGAHIWRGIVDDAITLFGARPDSVAEFCQGV